MPRQRIAIIGAGPSGCAVLNAFRHDNQLENFEIVCFEKQKSIGGQWNLDWRSGYDQNGEPVHSGMYKHLWANSPKECLEFPDKSMADLYGRAVPSYVPRPVIEKYIKDRFEVPEILERIRFQTVVKNIRFDEETEKFHIDSYSCSFESKSKEEKNETSEIFDYLFVCSGHYQKPHIIHKPGFEDFEGPIIHAHDFRDGCHFRNQTVVTIGSSLSAEDIASNCIKYGVKKVYLSARDKPENSWWYSYNWPENIERVPDIAKIEGRKIYFDNSGRYQHDPIEADAIICCTGYRYDYQYLEKKLRLESAPPELDSLYPRGLYKGIFWNENPKVMYIGAFRNILTMPVFEIQSWYARDVILGRIKMPESREVRQQSNEAWREKLSKLPNEISTIRYQGAWIKDLLQEIDYFGGSFGIDQALDTREEFVNNKVNVTIMGYRDFAHTDPVTKQRNPKLNATWMDIKDDSMEAFFELLESSVKK